MKKGILNIILLSILFLTNASGQISPGDLTTAHADLEGIRNCTQCHDLGNKVTNTKCLACHEEIQDLTDQNRGFHASKEVKGKDCATCHSEHHGRKFDMSRFDEDNFDHDLTSYELTGGHLKIDCRECHIPEFIADADIKKREDTFLGLEHDCISCHEDVHQNTLSTQDCASCHDTEAFAPATFFDHDDTEYPLTGKHVDVECIECHQKETRNGKEFQVFTGLEFNNCISCHDDVHENNLGTNCKQCHSTESFTSLRRIRRFDHNTTNFPLKGAHQQTDCFECHSQNESLVDMFQDRMGIQTNDCVECHEDVHDNKFGTNCIECHNEQAWVSVDLDVFDHNRTDYPLEGIHREVDCKECHTTNLTDPLAHSQCVDCHEDYHEGQFMVAATGFTPDCAECHTVDGFEGSLFTIENHQETKFPLEGAHIATPCFACHLPDDKWEFRNIGERCVDCHEDVHEGFIAAEFYPNQECTTCHTNDNWTDNLFDHTLTEFALEGAHAEVACLECHTADVANGENQWAGFVETPMECASCHENVHGTQFEVAGITDCARCHGVNNWGMDDFNHDNTAFPLEGKHVEVACESCHKPIDVNGETITQYKFPSFECIVCHGD